MTLPYVRYLFDKTGTNPDNLVQGEVHELSSRPIRGVVPIHGPFYTDSIVLYDHVTNRELVKGEGADYTITALLQELSLRVGHSVSQVILIHNTDVSDQVRVTYQCVGGPYQSYAKAISDMYEAALIDDRPVDWENVNNKPYEYNPALHRHLLEDIVGFEPVVVALERIAQAIVLSNIPAFETLIEWVEGRVLGIADDLQAHIDDKDNPHETDAHQVGTYFDHELDAFLNAIWNDLNSHTSNTSNPHNTTAHQTGAYTQAEVNSLLANLQSTINGNISALAVMKAGDTMTGRLFTARLPLAMAQDGGANNGAITVRASGSGDANLAGITFHHDAYAIKMGVRADGYFGVGGWSRGPWSFYSDSSGNFTVAGNMSAYSDPRLKEGLTPILSASYTLKQIKSYHFYWKDGYQHTANKAGKKDVGFMSDNIKALIPEIVSPSITLDGQTFDTVDYSKITPYLVAGHNEHTEIIESLVDEIRELKKELMELKARK